jgi:hypothetical protein
VIELADSQLTPHQVVAAANAKIQELCQRAFDKGRLFGYQRGYEDAIAAMNAATQPAEVLFNKPNDA